MSVVVVVVDVVEVELVVDVVVDVEVEVVESMTVVVDEVVVVPLVEVVHAATTSANKAIAVMILLDTLAPLRLRARSVSNRDVAGNRPGSPRAVLGLVMHAVQ